MRQHENGWWRWISIDKFEHLYGEKNKCPRMLFLLCSNAYLPSLLSIPLNKICRCRCSLISALLFFFIFFFTLTEVTACLHISAPGITFPPHFIFQSHLVNFTISRHFVSSWISSHLCYEWMYLYNLSNPSIAQTMHYPIVLMCEIK